MKIKVTDEGLLIPKAMLPGVNEVDIRKEHHSIIITPTQADGDPILQLGTSPVDDDITDGAINHDRYLYAPECGFRGSPGD